jgi:Hypothetical protein (DUF2513)
MKLDYELLRWILNEVESCEAGNPVVLIKGVYNGAHYSLDIGERDFAEVCEHMLLLGDEELAVVRDLGRVMEGRMGVVIDRLTMEGHNFLEAARDETRWSKAMKTVQEKGGGAVTIGVLIQLLSALMKQSLGIQ